MTVQDVDNAFRKKAESNVKLYVIRKKIENGTATMEDMSEYSNILCKLLGKTLGENISGIPESERAKFCEWLLRNQYEDTNERLATVQRFLDKKQNIHIAAKKPKFPAERVRKAAHSLEDKTVSEEVIQRRAENAVANIANSFHDDYIKENAEFRQNAGLKCHVTRTGASKCCAWCAEVAGRYEVGKEPADFWRRHDNCSCRMDYENQKVRQRLSGAGKGWKVDSETQRRQAQRIEYKPKRLSREEAKALEQQKLSQMKGLTNQTLHDIIEDKETNTILNTRLFHGKVRHYAITDERINHIDLVKIDSLSKSESIKLTEACKELLNYMKEEPLGKEGAFIFRLDMSPLDKYKASGATSSVRFRKQSEKCIVIHNHSSDTLLSDDDLWCFYEHDEIQIMGAVGHNGSTFFVEKTNDYDFLGFCNFMEESKLDFPIKMSAAERVQYVERIMEGAEEYGVKFYTKIYKKSD